MDIPYYGDLVLLRRYMEEGIYRFPSRKCRQSTRILKKTHGFEEVAGHYVHEDGARFWHAWNYDLERNLWIDLTSDQFEDTPDKIIIVERPWAKLIAMEGHTNVQRGRVLSGDLDGFHDVLRKYALTHRLATA
jgi:hypothetical protein